MSEQGIPCRALGRPVVLLLSRTLANEMEWPSRVLSLARFLASRSGQSYLHHFWWIFVQPVLYLNSSLPLVSSLDCLQSPLKLIA